MGKLIITYKTAILAHHESKKLPKKHPERIKMEKLINQYNSYKPQVLKPNMPEMDYVIIK